MVYFRRGQFSVESVFLVVILFGIGITIVIANMVNKDINAELQNDTSMQPVALADLQGSVTRFPQYMDNVVMLALILIWAVMLITSYFIDTHPVFFVVGLLLLLFLIGAVITVSNTYEDFITDSDVASFALDFPKTNYIMQHMVIIMVLITLTTGIVLYAKPTG